MKKIALYNDVMSVFGEENSNQNNVLEEKELKELIENHERFIKPDFLFIMNLRSSERRIIFEKNYGLNGDVNFEKIMSAVSKDDLEKLIQIDRVSALFSNHYFKEPFQYLMTVLIPVEMKKGCCEVLHRTTTIMKMDGETPSHVLGYFHLDKKPTSTYKNQLSYYFSSGQTETKETKNISRLFNEILKSSFLLTKQEVTILTLLYQGESSKSIADKLFISINTVNTHRQKILKKMEVKNSTGAIQKALENGII